MSTKYDAIQSTRIGKHGIAESCTRLVVRTRDYTRLAGDEMALAIAEMRRHRRRLRNREVSA